MPTTQQLTVAVYDGPNGTGNVLAGEAVTFTSMDPSVATVDSAGLITRVAAGSTTVRVADATDPTVYTDVPVTVGTVVAPAAAPSGVTLTAPSAPTVHVVWTDNASDESGFVVQRAAGLSALTGFATVGTVGANTTSYDDTTAVAGAPYTYRVGATKAGAATAYSSGANITVPSSGPPPTPPTAPGQPTLTTPSAPTVHGVFTASVGADDVIVERANGLGQTTGFAQVGSALAANATTFDDATAVAGTAYTYRLTARKGGTSNVPGTPASITVPSGGGGGFVAPVATDLYAVANGGYGTAEPDENLYFAWTHGGGAGLTGFRIERRDPSGSGTWTDMGFTDLNDPTCRSHLLLAVPRAQRDYRVVALYTGGESSPSNALTGQTWGGGSGPTAVSDLGYTIDAPTQKVTLNWTNPGGGAPVVEPQLSFAGTTFIYFGWQFGTTTQGTGSVLNDTHTLLIDQASGTTRYYRIDLIGPTGRSHGNIVSVTMP